MKYQKILLVILILFFLIPLSSFAKSPRFKNKLREQASREAFEEQIENIPIYRDKLEGKYTIIGYVKADDVLTKDKKAIIKQLRYKAYQVNADAIMEFQCNLGWKSLYQTCQGFAIKYVE